MRNIKKMFILAFALVFIVSFLGCGNTTREETMVDTTSKQETGTEAETELAIGTENQVNLETETSSKTDAIELSEQAANFVLTDREGNEVTPETLLGEKTYLKYWASWCSICLSGMSEIDELFESTDEFTLYTVVTPDTYGEMSKEDFLTWFDSLEYKNVQVLFDKDGNFAKEVQVRAFPTSLFLNSSMEIEQIAVGHKSNEEIIQAMDQLE